VKPEKAAEIIVSGILKNKGNVIVGNDAKKAIFAYKYLPFLVKKIARQTMKEFKS